MSFPRCKIKVHLPDAPRAKWVAGEVVGRRAAPSSFAALGKTEDWYDVKTDDGRVWTYCNPDCVRVSSSKLSDFCRDYNYRGFSIRFVSADEARVDVRVAFPDGREFFRDAFLPLVPQNIHKLIEREVDLKVEFAERVLAVARSASPYR